MLFVVLSFFAIGLMRVIQKVCGKRVSNLLNDKPTFFQYGAYYQALSAILALILLFFLGFDGFNLATVLCALATALCFAIDLFSGVEALKGATMSICNMVAMGGLFIPCIVGIFLFDEPMSVMQWVGLVIFIVSVYFLARDSKNTYKKFSLKTLVMLIVSLVINGVVTVVQKYFALLVPDGNVALFSFLTFGQNSLIMFICMCVFILLEKKKGKEKQEGKTEENVESLKEEKVKLVRLNKTLLICGSLLAVAVFVINQLVTTMARTVPSVVLFTVSGAISIIITSFVGALVYGEKITVKNIIGLILGLGSIVIVNVF